MPVGGSRGSLLGNIQRLFEDGTVVGTGEGQLLDRFVRTSRRGRRSRRSSAATGRWSWASAGASSATPTTPRTPSRPRSSSWPARPGRSATGSVLRNWLHGVAYRVASRARVIANRSRGICGRASRRSRPERSRPDRVPRAAIGPRRGDPPTPGALPRSGRAPLLRGSDPRRDRRATLLSGGDDPQPADPGAGTAARPAVPPRPRPGTGADVPDAGIRAIGASRSP